MIYIYILKCRNNKYYVGKTENPSFRLDDHFSGAGSEFTKLYKPIKRLELIEDCDKYDEDKYVLKYMEKYGIDNVRGGSYSNLRLEASQIESISHQMISANDLCNRCLRSGHFEKDCYAKTDIDGKYIGDGKKRKSYKSKVMHEEIYSSDDEEKLICYRCGRGGHYSDECFARKHIKGYNLH
jgi:hypothetical protein